MFSQVRFLVVGAGFSGAVLAERLASAGEKVVVIDRRKHIGGTSFSERDPETGIECHRYGSHIFHTSLRDVWDYIGKFTRFNTYQHKVLISCGGRVFQMPINLKTINDFYGMNLKPYEVKDFIEQENRKSKHADISNLEEKAISLIGVKLYNAFIKGYTQKQWNCEPKYLPPEIITRLPVRNNYNANYFNDSWQGIPLDGYGELFRHLLSHPNIEVRLGIDFRDIRDQLSPECTVFYSGRLDELYDCCFGELGWRSLDFQWKNLPMQDWQGTAVMNFGHPERSENFNAPHTTICYEYPQTYHCGMEAYYPVETRENLEKYQQYRKLLTGSGIIPIGRLGAYKYWDMDKAIKNSLDVFEQFRKGKAQ